MHKSKFEHLPRREGFWYSKYEPELPRPRPRDHPWLGQHAFLAAYDSILAHVESQLYKGFSSCRICGLCPNGSATFVLEGWHWPSGFRHYVEEHNVRPSLAFQEFVLAYALYLKDKS